MPGSNARRVRRPEPGAESPQVAAAASRLKAAYTEEMRRVLSSYAGTSMPYQPSSCWDGGEDSRGGAEARKARRSTWAKAAETLLAEGIEPSVYVSLLFRALPDGIRFPEPNQLLSSAFRAAYSQAAHSLVPMLRASLRSQELDAETRITIETRGESSRLVAAMQGIVVDSTKYSPLYRYCFARSVVRKLAQPSPQAALRWFQRQSEMLRPAALAEYRRYPAAYLEAWGTRVIPTEIANAVHEEDPDGEEE